jgi:hypothetical protein
MECKTKENIPKEVVKYFDEMDQSNINEPPCFSCEKCGGAIKPQNIVEYMEKNMNYKIKTIEKSKSLWF